MQEGGGGLRAAQPPPPGTRQPAQTTGPLRSGFSGCRRDQLGLPLCASPNTYHAKDPATGSPQPALPDPRKAPSPQGWLSLRTGQTLSLRTEMFSLTGALWLAQSLWKGCLQEEAAAWVLHDRMRGSGQPVQRPERAQATGKEGTPAKGSGQLELTHRDMRQPRAFCAWGLSKETDRREIVGTSLTVSRGSGSGCCRDRPLGDGEEAAQLPLLRWLTPGKGGQAAPWLPPLTPPHPGSAANLCP